MHNLLSKLLKRFYTPTQLRFEGITFHDVKHSNLLKNIWRFGPQGYEPELVHFFKTYPFAFKTFMDCGANIGVFSSLISKNHTHATIMAFEPFAKNINYLKTLQRNNKIDFTLHEVGLFNVSKRLAFHIPNAPHSSNLASSASLNPNFEKQTYTTEIQVEPFAKFLAPLTSDDYPLLIKMDIEDAELEALQSIETHLKGYDIDLVVEIVIESEKRFALYDFLKSCGYSSYLITNAGLVQENRPLTLPKPDAPIPIKRTAWKNHYFTKRSIKDVKRFSEEKFGHFI